MQRAALAGIRNLHSASFKSSSPLRMVQSRFPEKYERTVMAVDDHTSTGGGGADNQGDLTS